LPDNGIERNVSAMTSPTWATMPAELLTLADGRSVYSWERTLSADVWIAREDRIESDGSTTAGTATVHAVSTPEGLDLDAARKLAADLLAAVELAAETSPSAQR